MVEFLTLLFSVVQRVCNKVYTGKSVVFEFCNSSIYPYSPASVTKGNECVVRELQYGDYLCER